MIYEEFSLSNQYSIIFIGSGIANLTCALELSKNTNKEIIILEAGSENYDKLSKSYFEGELSGENYHDLTDCRYRGFLGSANLWYGWCKPMFENVLKTWNIEELNNKKYFNQTVNFLNLDENFRSSEVLSKYENFQIKYCDVKSLNKNLKRKIYNDQKIKVILNTQVLSIDKNENSYDLNIIQNNKKKKNKYKFFNSWSWVF